MKKIWHGITSAPYSYLPWLLLAYVVLSSLMLQRYGIYDGHLIGYDDQVRMTQVLEWVNGHSWYDRTITRVNAPEGFTTIWSRIVDIPIALVIIAAQQFVSQKTAALIAAAVVPLAELAVLFIAMPYFVRPLVGKKQARLVLLFVFFSSILALKFFSASGFIIGQASHHPWYIILAPTMFGATARLVLGSWNLSPVLILAASLAIFNTVGIEGFPLIAGAAGMMALTGWAFGRPAITSRGGDAFICGAICAFIMLPIHQPPEKLLIPSFVEPSILGVLLFLIAGFYLKFEAAMLRRLKDKQTAAVVLCLAAALIAGILISIFPQILDGGAAGLSPLERMMALHDHFEAKSLWGNAMDVADFANLVMPIVLGLGFGIYAVLHSHGRRRALAVCYLGFAALGGFMTGQYSRFYHHAMTTACAWLLWGWEQIKLRLRKNKDYTMYAFLTFVGLGPLWMLFLPALERNAPVMSNVLFFPAAVQYSVDYCDSLKLASWLDENYPPETDLDVPSWLSAQFLYQSNLHIDFLANYPSQDKFLDSYHFFGARKAEEAQPIAASHHVDLVAVCLIPLLFNPNYPDDMQSFLSQLQVGHAPKWLKPVQIPVNNYKLYAVDKKAVEQEP